MKSLIFKYLLFWVIIYLIPYFVIVNKTEDGLRKHLSYNIESEKECGCSAEKIEEYIEYNNKLKNKDYNFLVGKTLSVFYIVFYIAFAFFGIFFVVYIITFYYDLIASDKDKKERRQEKRKQKRINKFYLKHQNDN